MSEDYIISVFVQKEKDKLLLMFETYGYLNFTKSVVSMAACFFLACQGLYDISRNVINNLFHLCPLLKARMLCN
jgi:hypothetical protein